MHSICDMYVSLCDMYVSHLILSKYTANFMEIFRTIAKISLFYCWGILIWATLYNNLVNPLHGLWLAEVIC